METKELKSKVKSSKKEETVMKSSKLSIMRVRPYIGQDGKCYLSYSVDGRLKRVGRSVIEVIIDGNGNVLQMSPSINDILNAEIINVTKNGNGQGDTANVAVNKSVEKEIPF